MKNYNKREKIANVLFDVVKYVLTIIIIGNIFGKFNWFQMLLGFVLALGVGVTAYFITPEKES